MAKNEVTPVDPEEGDRTLKNSVMSDAKLVTDPREAGRAIVERILAAETVEDILTQNSAAGTDDLLDKPIMVFDADWRESAHKEGPGFFAVVKYREYDVKAGEIKGEKELTATLGGQNVLAQLARIKQLGGFPFPCKLIKAAKPTAAGYYPLWLTTAE